ncbi:MAG TPA: type II and III secretion system protein [Chthoniobacterales bacterium]|nr:type II and III secretion system protein [Chthoniobacterales bacterium]
MKLIYTIGIAMVIILLLEGLTLPSASAVNREILPSTSCNQPNCSDLTKEAHLQINQGDKAMQQHDDDLAFLSYKTAFDLLPNNQNCFQSLRAESLKKLSQATVALAKQRIAVGDTTGASSLIDPLLKPPYCATFPPLLALAKKLCQIKQTKCTKTSPRLAQQHAAVEQLLKKAQYYYELGEWDQSFKNYEKILTIDPNNSMARGGMEHVDRERSAYAENIATERRSELLEKVDHAWELLPSNDLHDETQIVHQAPIRTSGIHALAHKLHTLKFSNIEFSETNLRDALDDIKQKAILLDTSELDPNKKGINIVLQTNSESNQCAQEPKVTLSFTDIPLEDLLKYIAQQSNLKIKLEPYAVVIVPQDDPTETFITKEYKVPPNFLATFPMTLSSKIEENNLASKKIEKFGAKELLLSQGVTFPPGASANYLVASSLLIVKNSQANLDLIDSLVEVSLATPPIQVEIEARFLEVKQNNLEELGIDWLLGSFPLPGSKNTHAGGGTIGNQDSCHPANYPIQCNGIPVGSILGGPLGAGSLTAGNRTGSAAIRANPLDTLLLGGQAGPAAGILALAGVFTTPQFQVVLRALNQQKGIDLLSSPKVTVSSGHRATITIAKEFPYPAEYTPPQVPYSQGNGVNPVTPTTPSSFKTRKIGVELEVEPIVHPDGKSIELNLSPQITEFQGFVNYGSPIFSQAPILPGIGQTNIIVGTVPVLLTENPINQPVFSVRQVDTQVTLRDGQTVVLGGLLREDIQKVQDKTPIIGDLPLVGSLFRSSSHQKIKRNLLIFVTVGLIDPSGRPAGNYSANRPNS